MELLTIVFLGLSQGAVYCIFALGLALVYSTSRTLNFAHGSIYMLGAYLAWVMTGEALSLPFLVMLGVLCVLLFLFGVIVDQFLVRPLRRRDDAKIATMIATLGLAFLIDNFNLIAFGATSRSFPVAIDGSFQFANATVSRQSVFVMVAALAVVTVMQLYLRFTRMGMAMRAVAQDSVGAAIVGIPAERVYAVSFGISAVLAGIAAVLLSPVTLISPLGGWALFVKAFVIVVFGGLGSIQGVLYAAFILGLVEAFVISFLGASWTMPVWFVVLLVVLMVRPQGLLGKWAG